MLKFIILIVVFVSLCDTVCREQYDGIHCDTVQDVRKLEQQENWTKIYISRGKNQRINGLTFTKTPNVVDLDFWNAVKDIEEFTFYNLSSLKRLQFQNCDLQIIKKNWFSGLSSISRISIIGSNVQSLEPGCIGGSTNLTDVAITHNNISSIVGNVFSGTPIVSLDLKSNQIQFIQDNAFINMSHLKTLVLNNNLLKSFIPKVILPNLQQLHIYSNQIEMIPSGALHGLSNLYFLDVSCNKLESFPESAFPITGLPSLRHFFLGNNRLNYMPKNFILYLPKLDIINIFGNPWQCGCYKDIVNSILLHNVSILHADEYLNGTRPVCIVPQTGSDSCLENTQITDNLNDFIQQILPCPTFD